MTIPCLLPAEVNQIKGSRGIRKLDTNPSPLHACLQTCVRARREREAKA